MVLRVVIWTMYFVGCFLVFASWAGSVSTEVGWIGWLIGMAGWVLGMTPLARKLSIAKDLSRLSAMHKAGELTD